MTQTEEGPGPASKVRSRISARRIDYRIAVGGIVFGGLVLTSILAGQLAPYDPFSQALQNRFAPPSSEHWLGSDAFGRDMLSRLIMGGRFSLLVGALSVAVGGLIGTVLGIVSGYLRGWLDIVVMRITDALLTFPTLLMALLIVATLGPSTRNLIIAISTAVVPRFTRIVRSAVITVSELDYVTAARIAGASSTRIMRTEILPNITSPLIVTTSFMLATAILAEASLGFLGLGVQPPLPTWGNMINDALPRVRTWPMGATIPGLAIMMAVLSLNLLGDGLRDVLDPKTGGEILR